MKSAGSYGAANKDERDTIVCYENGFGQAKDMPYGIYTVHQTSGWEGREMMDDFDDTSSSANRRPRSTNVSILPYHPYHSNLN